MFSDGRWTLEGLLEHFRHEVPIDGLEVDHPLHEHAQTVAFRGYAQRHGLLTSAGSDAHGPERPPIPYPARSCRGLLERLGVAVDRGARAARPSHP